MEERKACQSRNKNWKRTQLPNMNKDRKFGEDRDNGKTRRERKRIK